MSQIGTGVSGSPRKIVPHLPKLEKVSDVVGRIIVEVGNRRGEPEFKTGLEVVDKGLFGLHRKQLTILAARTGNGKTSLACNVAFNLADAGKKVAIVSLEMAREQIVSKIFCSENNVNSFKLLIGRVSQEEKRRLEAFQKLVEELPLRIIDDYCFTQDELYTLIDHLEFKPDVLIIDHLQHIRAITSGRTSERENLAEYLRFLKETAMRHNIAVMCLSQINREGDEKPTLKHLKGTGALEEMADHVMLLSLVRKTNPFEENTQEKIEAIVEIAKNRFGPIGYFNLMFDAPIGKFFNVDKYHAPLETGHDGTIGKDYHDRD